MAAPKFVQARKTTLYSSITDAEASAIVLKNLVDIGGVALAMSDFQDTLYLTLEPGSENEEIISCTDFTVNADGTVTLDTGIVRGLLPKAPYSTGGVAHDHAAGSFVVVSDQPQLYNAIIAYIDGIAIAGASDASLTSKGIVEMATSAEIDAGTATGSTGAPLAISPDKLLASGFGTNLVTASEKQFIQASPGMILPYVGVSAPTGFLLCDGSSADNDTYPALAALILGKYGYGTGTDFTAVAATDVITATGHGLSDGDRVFVDSTGTLPAGLSAHTLYYVISSTTNTLKLSLTSGGSAVDITDTGSGTHTLYNNFLTPDLRGRSIIGMGTGTKTATFVSRASNVITVKGISNTADNEFQTGQAIVYHTTGSVITGLTDGNTYYLIRTGNATFSLASSLANAQNGTAIALSSDGSGVQTFVRTLTARTIGDTGGEGTHAMSLTELLNHSHTFTFHDANAGGSDKYPNAAGTALQAGTYTVGGQVSAGGNAAMNNMQPFAVANHIIKT